MYIRPMHVFDSAKHCDCTFKAVASLLQLLFAFSRYTARANKFVKLLVKIFVKVEIVLEKKLCNFGRNN